MSKRRNQQSLAQFGFTKKATINNVEHSSAPVLRSEGTPDQLFSPAATESVAAADRQPPVREPQPPDVNIISDSGEESEATPADFHNDRQVDSSEEESSGAEPSVEATVAAPAFVYLY